MAMTRIVIALLSSALLFAANVRAATPCLSTSENCTEWIALHGSSRSLVYRTYPLEIRNDNVKRAFVMVHGAGRDADNYYRTSLAAGFLGGALDDTIIVALRLASNDGRACKDKLADHEISWNCFSWRSGGPALSDAQVTSFDFMDE